MCLFSLRGVVAQLELELGPFVTSLMGKKMNVLIARFEFYNNA